MLIKHTAAIQFYSHRCVIGVIYNMYMKKVILALLAAIVMGTALGQVTNYESLWKSIDALMEKGSYNTAFEQTQALFAQAQQTRNSRQALTAAAYLASIENAYREDATDSTLQRYLALLPTLQPVDRAICHTLIAQLYYDYKQQNQWHINDNRPTDEAELDYKLWSSGRYDTVIATHLSDALADEQLLQSVKSTDIIRLLNADPKAKYDYNLTPTLFDVIINHAISMATSDNTRSDVPSILAKRPLMEKLIAFHRNDDDCIRIYLDQMLLTTFKNPDYDSYINKNRGTACPLLADLYYSKAARLKERKDYLAAVATCDTGYALFPESAGGAECANLKRQITDPYIKIDILERQMEQRDMLATATVRNVNTLHFRIIQWVDLNRVSNDREYLAKRPVIKEWQQPCDAPADHTAQDFVCYLPAMPAGHYYLMVSSSDDFAKQGFSFAEFYACDASLMVTHQDGLTATCRLISRATGKPISNVKLELRESDWREENRKLITSATTDADGYATFANPDTMNHYGRYFVRYNYHGVTEDYTLYFDKKLVDTSILWQIFLDQPVYKPGDSVRFMAVGYRSDGKRKAQVCTGVDINLMLKDVNAKVRDSLRLTTDDFGQVHGVFVLPPDALPGQWSIIGFSQLRRSIYKSFSVQYYKQPKFTIKMPADSAEHHFGQPVDVTGSAVSYTEMPVGGARVQWSVTRRGIRPFWRWWWNPQSSAASVVASGTTTTSSNGTFRITFVPLPDSSIDLSAKPCFAYEISAQVTDLNGETHEQRRDLRIGYRNSGFVIPIGGDVDQLTSVTYQYINLDNQPLAGNVHVTVEELRQPATAKLAVIDNERQTISREEFARRYPLYSYSADEVNPQFWPVKKTVLRTTHQASKTKPNEVPLPSLPSGVYRISVSTADAAGDTVSDTSIVTLTLPTERRPQSTELLWTHINKTTAEVGDTVVLSIGSRFRDVEITYGLDIDRKIHQRRHLTLNNEVQTIAIPVTEAMRGGFVLYLCAALENTIATYHEWVTVPYSNKKLDVRLVTFRNKLEPGQQETWTIQITPAAPRAALMLTMYDNALNTYGRLSWNLWPWWNNDNARYNYFYISQALSEYRNLFASSPWLSGQDPLFIHWQLKSSMYSPSYYGRGRRLNAMGNSRKAVPMSKTAEVEEEEVYSIALEGSAACIAADNDVIATIQTPLNKEIPDDRQKGSPAPVRQNLRTLAFFHPELLTDDSGRVSVTFRVPDLLTQWSIQGLAYTQELHVGNLHATAVTAKELMVVPNVPRFLRQGDQSDILVKVANASDKEQSVNVTLQLSDAATGRTFYSHSDACRIAAHGSTAVTFPVAVPTGVFAATYRVTAESATHSDGEQDVIPVLTNRVLVTESMSMYINGRGEKSYTMKSLRDNHSTTLQHHALSVEFTANPVWYAIQALPYVEDHKNPSNIYLANAIYANTVGSRIVARHPEIESTFRHWMEQEPDALTSRLEQNQEVKQTLLQETPWLRDGNDETARQRRVANFFDRKAMETSLAQATDKLKESQSSNGGWSWIAGGRYTSEWTTSYILKAYGRLALKSDAEAAAPASHTSAVKEMLNRALNYVDGENYKYYLQCRRNNSNATNIDYLYMRSFYADKTLSAKCRQSYDYFYRNALSRYKDYTDLGTMAQLALVFHRHGDSREALDIVRRIRERSISSDEMGMYWRDNVSGLFSHQRPVEVQCLLIEAFETVQPSDTQSPALMRQWLLKQKQTTSWKTDVATVDAVRTLLSDGGQLDESRAASLTLVVGADTIAAQQYATGYRRQQWDADHIGPRQSEVHLSKSTDGVAWGAMYWQYFEDLDKVPYSTMGVKMQKTLYRLLPSGSMTVVNDGARLHVGDKVRVRIVIDCDRTLEYLELKDPRPSAFEPVSTASGWKWNGGLSYYTAVYNASTSFFIDRMEKGKYVLEYDMYVTASGSRQALGGATLQSMYAPEFRANTPGVVLTVEPQRQ